MRRILIAVLLLAVAAGCGGDGSPLPPAPETDEPEDVVAEPATAEETEPASPEDAPAASPPIEAGSWTINITTNPLDDSRTVVALLNAAEGVGGVIDPKPITLVARCQSNESDVFIGWHDFLGDDELNDVYSDRKRVTYRFPPADAQTEMWNVSTDNAMTFVGSPIPFLRTLVESERLVVQTTPYGESPSTAIFTLAGATNAISPIADECGWTLDRASAEREAQQRVEERDRELARRLAPFEEGITFSGSGMDGIGTIGGVGIARGGLPDGIDEAHFPGVDAGRLMAVSGTQGDDRVFCPRAAVQDGKMLLVECRIALTEEARSIIDKYAEGVEFPAGFSNVGSVAVARGSSTMTSRAIGGLPNGISEARFPGVPVRELEALSRIRSWEDPGTVHCSHAEPQSDGTIHLVECRIVEGVTPRPQ